MKHSRILTIALLLLAVAGSGVLLAVDDIPLNNWTVPPYHASSGSGGLTTMTDVTPGIGFVGVAPCRLLDTRGNGFTGAYGPPSLAAGVPRNFDLNSDPACTGIPAGVEAYSLNITVTQAQGDGFILIYPQGGSQPPVSTLNYHFGDTLANAAIVPAGTGGGVTVIAGVSGTHLIIDINGYFTDEYEGSTYFQVFANNGSYAIEAENNSTSCGGTCGMLMTVQGGNALEARAQGTGVTYGVFGNQYSGADNAAGVYGEAGSGQCGVPNFGMGILGRAGAAATLDIPIIGLGDYEGVRGINTNGCTGSSPVASYGSLGWSDTDAVHGSGNLSITGTKSFVDPHPTDASKMIAYVSLEGPESGTYFRGRGKFQNGIAVIDVPEHFRMVTDREGLGIQVTPIGQMASVAVESISLDRIVVRGSRNVEFFYTVNGVRATFKDFQPIQDNNSFVAISENSGMIGAWSPEQKRRLIANGSFNADGTVNLETAHRLGWDKVWEKSRVQPQKQNLSTESKGGVSSNHQ
jgi:hypothetical protein